MAAELFEAGGIEGMVGGQWLDLEAERRTLTLPQLMAVHRGKTGALIRASCTLGGIAAEAAPAQVAALTAFGEDIGLAFQIADDVLDATGTSEELGKTAGRDAAARQVHLRRRCSASTALGGRPKRWPGGRSSTSSGRGCRRGHSGRWRGIL